MHMDGTTRRALAHNVKRLRQRAGWNQTELAQRAGLAQTLVSYLERPDGKSPTLATIVSIAHALRIPLWALLLPELPDDPAVAHRLDKLADTYLHIGPDGQRTLDTIAEAEARYDSARKSSA
jgi:transcriptional regulator with XRE-family HTH domain